MLKTDSLTLVTVGPFLRYNANPSVTSTAQSLSVIYYSASRLALSTDFRRVTRAACFRSCAQTYSDVRTTVSTPSYQ